MIEGGKQRKRLAVFLLLKGQGEGWLEGRGGGGASPAFSQIIEIRAFTHNIHLRPELIVDLMVV